ncbi:hypothetical protein BRARA_I05142 [Brassica rapa]|uniref:Uncharacterized protein n=2 Tax=Brassica TaxID=3705 RepID=A0A397Y4U1_BRACM|nr:uncharacterized protein BNAANNG30210D [Brassica napus]RID48639.1 hypothetical protein BRARA_I05142 [Brassica rapa]CAF2051268.1 unnamed protein product [Brassica napus]CAG7867212.1 unnamed protein product [Brassica rapa]CDY69367.1 BnaAnng30210D [Brassica napus]VDC64149.1 unnamed protein product [Brassica rapa]
MKKLYKKGTVHPSPQIKSDDQLLSLLPVAIFSLAAVLSPQDREVLAYLISTASYSGERNFTSRVNKTKPRIVSHFDNHSPLFHCDCFSCYTSYWVRWDSSPSRQLIHEIIDAFEDSLEKKKTQTKKKKNVAGKKNRRKPSGKSSALASPSFGLNDSEVPSRLSDESITSSSSSELVDGTCSCNDSLETTAELQTGKDGEEAAEEKGSFKRFVSFIGEKVFGVWG